MLIILFVYSLKSGHYQEDNFYIGFYLKMQCLLFNGQDL